MTVVKSCLILSRTVTDEVGIWLIVYLELPGLVYYYYGERDIFVCKDLYRRYSLYSLRDDFHHIRHNATRRFRKQAKDEWFPAHLMQLQ